MTTDGSAPPASAHSLLLDLGHRLSGSLDLGNVLSASLEAVRALVDFRGGSIALVEDGFLSVAVADPNVSDEVAALRLPIGHGLSGRVASTGRSIYSPDLDDDERVDPQVRKAGSNRSIATYFAVPVVAGGDVVGVLQLDSPHKDAFAPDERGLIAALAPLMGAAIQNARTYAAQIDTSQRLDELHELRSNFLAVVTHELRTPLTLFLGFAELLARAGKDLPQGMTLEEAIARMDSSLDRFEGLVDELQHLALLDTGTLAVRLDEVALAPIVQSVVAPVRIARAVEVRVGDETTVIGDGDRLTDALAALVDNAVKFSPQGTPISIEAKRDGAIIEIEVVDQGPGVSPDIERFIFDRFAQAQTPSTRRVGGLGIGLSLARALVRRMGGDIGVVPGEGGRFLIRLQATDR